MKKIMMLLAATMFLLGLSGQAMASFFADGDLIRVVYSATGGMETATDLTSVASLTSASTANQSFSTNNFSIGGLGSGATAANSYVAYYTVLAPGAPSPNNAWVSGNGTSQTASFTNFSGFEGAVHTVNGEYQVNGGTTSNQVTIATTDPNSYYKILSNGSGSGQMASFILAGGTEANLTALSTIGYVDQYLYYYQPQGRNNGTGTELVDIRTFADGHTEFNASQVATPIPATFLLFGSGLLGLVGIRRKQSV